MGRGRQREHDYSGCASQGWDSVKGHRSSNSIGAAPRSHQLWDAILCLKKGFPLISTKAPLLPKPEGMPVSNSCKVPCEVAFALDTAPDTAKKLVMKALSQSLLPN